MFHVITLMVDSLEDTTKSGISKVWNLENLTPDEVKKCTDELAELICLPEFRRKEGLSR